jgi:hypothetical protein
MYPLISSFSQNLRFHAFLALRNVKLVTKNKRDLFQEKSKRNLFQNKHVKGSII